ncbi:MAG: hypothetical protein NTZ33_13810 [Bacteroidetes bacterium]|nr:hypothetical protein [Bacteroidota bacterium]
MNKLITTDNGKLPIVLDDFRFLDTAVRDAFKGLVSAFGIAATDSFKISGCVVTIVGTTYNWTEGYLCLGGEILFVPAGSVVTPAVWPAGEFLEWIVDINYDIAGNKLFYDASSHDTYQIRTAKLAFGAVVQDLLGNYIYMPHNAEYIQTKILKLLSSTEILAAIDTADLFDKLRVSEEDWVDVAVFLNDWTQHGAPNENAGYKKDVFGMVHFRGAIDKGASNTNHLFTLPAKYRPSKTRYLPNLQILNDGTVWSVGLPAIVYLDGMSYKL